MRKRALLIINYENDVNYNNYIYLIIKKSLQVYGYNIKVIKDSKCTKRNVLNHLNKLKGLTLPNDKLIFYFSGHTIWSPWKKGFKFFDFKAYHVLSTGKKDWLSNGILMSILNKIKCRKLLLFDTCCGPLIQLNKSNDSEIVTVSNRLGKTKPILEDHHCTPSIAYLFKKMFLSKKKYFSLQDYVRNNSWRRYPALTFSGKKFIF